MTDRQNNQANIQLMAAKQLGLLLALSKRQVFRLNSCGKIPAPFRIGGALRWRQSDIELWQSLNCPDRATFEARKGGAV
ncbi:MAG: hypothetical protein DRP56_05845 [Planctomycetota bacterium]|nr:MAG: hypothetical protein DRP56_05845 [Planctomycetota bacterium]